MIGLIMWLAMAAGHEDAKAAYESAASRRVLLVSVNGKQAVCHKITEEK